MLEDSYGTPPLSACLGAHQGELCLAVTPDAGLGLAGPSRGCARVLCAERDPVGTAPSLCSHPPSQKSFPLNLCSHRLAMIPHPHFTLPQLTHLTSEAQRLPTSSSRKPS